MFIWTLWKTFIIFHYSKPATKIFLFFNTIFSIVCFWPVPSYSSNYRSSLHFEMGVGSQSILPIYNCKCFFHFEGLDRGILGMIYRSIPSGNLLIAATKSRSSKSCSFLLPLEPVCMNGCKRNMFTVHQWQQHLNLKVKKLIANNQEVKLGVQFESRGNTQSVKWGVLFIFFSLCL